MAATVIWTNDPAKWTKRIEKRVAEAVEETAKEIVNDAKGRAPVDTGHLRDSIAAQRIDEFGQVVAVHASYAAFVEYGTRHMAAQPFFIPALESAKQPFIQRIRKAFEQ